MGSIKGEIQTETMEWRSKRAIGERGCGSPKWGVDLEGSVFLHVPEKRERGLVEEFLLVFLGLCVQIGQTMSLGLII